MIEVRFGNGAGGFGDAASWGGLTNPDNLAIADLDDDGDDDIVVGQRESFIDDDVGKRNCSAL